MSILDAIYRMTHDSMTPTAAAPAPGATPLLPAAAPLHIAPNAPGGQSVLGALGNIVAPQAGSFWASALANGLAGAHAGQQNYADTMAQRPLAMRAAQTESALKEAETVAAQQKAKHGEFLTSPTGAIGHISPEGTIDWSAPPATKTSEERNLEFLQAMPEGPLKEVFKSMLLKQNDPNLVADKAAAAKEIARIRAGATVQSANIHAGATVTAAGMRKSSGALPPLPPGFKIEGN